MTLTDAQKEARAAELAEQRAEERQQRILEQEEKRHAEILAVWDQIPEDKRPIFEYIHKAIMTDRLGPGDDALAFINKTRDIHFREIERRVATRKRQEDTES